MKWFINITSLEDLKYQYRTLCFRYHPDRNPDTDTTATMQEINAEYKKAFEHLRMNDGYSEEHTAEEMQVEAEFMEKIQALAALPGIVIEIIGRWIWVSGNTYPVRETIRAAGFWFATKKKMWFWRPEDAKCRSREELSIEEVRQKHGSRVVVHNVSLIR